MSPFGPQLKGSPEATNMCRPDLLAVIVDSRFRPQGFAQPPAARNAGDNLLQCMGCHWRASVRCRGTADSCDRTNVGGGQISNEFES
jgi:hypothetical protein